MSTELATRDTGILTRYGSEQEIQTFMQRAAAIFQIPEEELARPDVQASLTKATQYCLNFGYLPGVHVHMIPFSKKISMPNPNNPNSTIEKWVSTYAPDLGEKAWKDSANRQAQMGRFAYVVETRAMTASEVKAETDRIPGQQYDPADAGCYARVLRTDHADLYKSVGSQYNPEWVTGFWRKKARERSGTWYADNVPVQRTPADVALRRATKAALMAVFTLVPLDEYTEAQRFRQLSAYVETETAETLPPLPVGVLHTNNGWETDENGDTWAAERPRLMAEERAKKTEPAPAIESLDNVEELDFDGPPSANDEFDAIKGPAKGQTANAHTAQQSTQPVAQPTNGQPASRNKMHAILSQMDGGIADKEGFRHFLVGKWSNGEYSTTTKLDDEDVVTFVEWLEQLKKNRLTDYKLSELRAEFQPA